MVAGGRRATSPIGRASFMASVAFQRTFGPKSTAVGGRRDARGVNPRVKDHVYDYDVDGAELIGERPPPGPDSAANANRKFRVAFEKERERERERERLRDFYE